MESWSLNLELSIVTLSDCLVPFLLPLRGYIWFGGVYFGLLFCSVVIQNKRGPETKFSSKYTLFFYIFSSFKKYIHIYIFSFYVDSTFRKYLFRV